MSVWWSVALAAVGLTGLWLAGKPSMRSVGWGIGVGAQTLWIAYAVATRQWGFLATALAYGFVFGRNWYRDRRPQHGFASPVWDETVDDPRQPVRHGWLTHDGAGNWAVVERGPNGEMLCPALDASTLIIHTTGEPVVGALVAFSELPRQGRVCPDGPVPQILASMYRREARRAESTPPTADPPTGNIWMTMESINRRRRLPRPLEGP